MIKESSKEIIRLILVISSSIVFAIFIALYFISFHSPSGKFFSRDVLISAEVLPKLKYKDPLAGNRLFYFDQITFSYFDIAEKRMKVLSVGLDIYQKFVNFVAKDSSIDETNLNLSDQFDFGDQNGFITITAREENGNFNTIIFQEIMFSKNGDYYRVNSLNKNNNYTYFYHPNVYKQTLVLLNK